jgi:hypothetical protein
MKASAPNLLFAGSQSFVKIFQPSLENHDEACWLVETAIRTRSPAPAGRRRARGSEAVIAERLS